MTMNLIAAASGLAGLLLGLLTRQSSGMRLGFLCGIQAERTRNGLPDCRGLAAKVAYVLRKPQGTP